MNITFKLARKIVKSPKDSNLHPNPEFGKERVIFFSIPQSFKSLVAEGEMWIFKYGALKNNNKVDSRQKPIYNCMAIPIMKIPFAEEKEANDFIRTVSRHLEQMAEISEGDVDSPQYRRKQDENGTFMEITVA